MPADHDSTELDHGAQTPSSPPQGGERDARHCGREKADGTLCRAYKVKGRDACAGHLGLGIGEDPAAHAKRAAERSAQVRQDRVEERRRRPQDVYTAALNDHAAEMAARLVKIATDPESSDADALRAIEALNSRVLGKPKELVETVTKPEELQRLEEMSDEEFFAEWRRHQAAQA